MDANSTQPDSPPRASGTLVSLCFWCSLLIAGSLFASATLSGKLLETEHHANQLANQSSRVEELALEVHRLELEARALETDPDYFAAVARRKLAGDSTEPAPTQKRATVSTTPAFTIDARFESLRPWMIRIASCSLLRARLLTIAAAIILFAFTFLHERPGRVAAE